MEELPEYQICEHCGKRGTPVSKTCWNCHKPYYPEGETIFLKPNRNNQEENISQENKEENKPEIEIETITPCGLEKLDLPGRIFAYKLLFNGDMLLNFCECETCRKSYREFLAFINEKDAEDSEIIKEAEEADIKNIEIDISVFS
ncbi:hypothetical protein [Methanoplanus endosymbiosus]|uniref:Uncharacterized protein n=1 Tax=Methanoplanus endosymbiosus TaxID=33865 RepID=A0A9E7PRC6_9EURY|nr:hypothetical protein [Methanoplanus endosymbiosus]UUX93561.1 hypothetical protein L6E24_05445 [Methanoplanus endosymbiosus]